MVHEIIYKFATFWTKYEDYSFTILSEIVDFGYLVFCMLHAIIYKFVNFWTKCQDYSLTSLSEIA